MDPQEVLFLTTGGALSLTGKIVWDWLKIRRNGNGNGWNGHERREDCPYRKEITELKNDTETIKLDLGTVKNDVSWMKNWVEKKLK